MSAPIAVILNSASGNQALGPDDVRAMFRESALDAKIIVPGEGQNVRGLARRVAHDGYAMVVAAGGDGTVSAVAGAIARTNIVLGVLPTGTFNHLARDLGIPQDMRAAVNLLTEGKVVEIDLGEVNGRVFVNNSSLGLYPRIVEGREQQRIHFGRAKWWALIRAALSEFRDMSFMKVNVTIGRANSGTDEVPRRTPFLFVGNNEYEIEGSDLGRRLHLNGGMLSMLVAHPRGRWGLVLLALRALFGRLRGARDLDAVTVPVVEVTVRRSHVQVALDGEVVRLEPPLRYRSMPAALRVMVPADRAGSFKVRSR